MKQKLLTIKSLLVAVLLGVGVSNAWGETVASLGNVDQDDAANNKTYVVAPNKTLTLSFTVSSTKGESEQQGYTVELRNTGDANQKMYMQPGGGFYYWGDAWWAETHIVKNDRSWAELSDFTTFIPGASVKLTIKRIHTQVLYYADIMTSSSVRHYRRLISSEGTFVENTNLDVKLGANHAVLTSITDEITDESITGTLIGKEDNSAGFGTNNYEYSLPENSSVSLHFINYSSKISNNDNWLLEIQKGDKYLDLRASGAGWQYNSDYYNESNFTKESTTGEYADNFPVALHKADVNMTITRSDNTITMQAVQNCVSGEVKTLTYTLTHADFASGAATVRLMADWSHLDLLPVSKAISAAGWATYCSPYALNLAGANATLEDAFIITGGADGVLTKSSVKSSTVPAGTGLLLKGSEGTVTIPIVGTSSTDVSSNKLVGKTANYELAANGGYVLMNDATHGLGFYKNANAFTVGANTAYLPAGFTVGAARAFYSFDEDVTGIDEAKSQKPMANCQYFDLQGRRVAQPTKGLYIMNGKKVIVK